MALGGFSNVATGKVAVVPVAPSTDTILPNVPVLFEPAKVSSLPIVNVPADNDPVILIVGVSAFALRYPPLLTTFQPVTT